jgi:diguanylate cyclase (GGDEF)-like protein
VNDDRAVRHDAVRQDAEAERLRAIRASDLADPRLVSELDDLVRLAARVTDSPMAAVSLIERETQLLLCTVGIEARVSPRGASICDHTIRGLGPLVVDDTATDPRFRDSPLVTGSPHIRSYAGAPVHVGHLPFGALCVLDVRPRVHSTEQLDLLGAVARQVDRLVELHRHRRAASAPDLETVQRFAAVIRDQADFDEMLGALDSPAWVVDVSTQRFLRVNDATVRGYGWSSDELVHLGALDLLAARESELVAASIASSVRDGKAIDGSVPLSFWNGRRLLHRRRDGEVFEVRLAIAALHFEGSDALLVMVSRLGDRGASELDAERAAAHDPLTGLGNRRLMNAILDAHLGAGDPLTLLVVDLDRFTTVDDAAGHRRGDELLVVAAARLCAVVPAEATVVRHRGDEFAVLLPRTDVEDSRQVADRVRIALARPYLLEVGEHTLTASIGIAESSTAMASADLVALAEEAARDATRAGGNYVVVADVAFRERRQRRERIARQLAAAEEREELQLCYQPVVALEGPRAGRVDLVEALLRWHPDRAALMPPTKFLDVAERAGLMAPIGRWVIGEACAAAARWHRAGRELRVSVNCSVRQFTPQLHSEVSDALALHGLEGDRLVLEVTEGAVMEDHDRAGRMIEALAALGVQVVIDDFGTGYTSLGRLQELAVAGLKVDRAFALGLATPQGFGLYRAMVEMADACGIEVTAEGIETPRQLHVVTGLGCASAQGFLLGRAAPEDVVPERSAFPVAASRERASLLDRYGAHAG